MESQPTLLIAALAGAITGGSLVYIVVRQRLARMRRKVERWATISNRLVKEGRRTQLMLAATQQASDDEADGLADLYSHLLQDERRLKAILETMSEGLALIHGDGRVVYSNPAFRSSIRVDSRGKISHESFEAESRTAFGDAIAEAASTRQTAATELRLQTTPPRDLLITATPYNDESISDGLILTAFDVTDRKRSEQLRTEFVANVSHELRTPLAAIRGYVETCLDAEKEDDGPPPYKRFLPIIHQHTLRLTALIEDLLILSRIESKGSQLRLQPGTIAQNVENALATLSPEAEKKRLSLVATLPPMLPPVMMDSGAVDRILINLIENAIKYSDEDSEILVTARPLNESIVISVSDKGVGIPKEDQNRIFERFYRVDKARSRKAGGTGLGLSIVKHLVISHGGDVWVDSTPGKGSTFFFTLGLAGQQELRAAARASPATAATR